MEEMMARLRCQKMPLYVVFDGARVNEIDTIFAANDLVGRAVFQGNDRAVVLAGPWIVAATSTEDNLGQIFALAERFGSGVC